MFHPNPVGRLLGAALLAVVAVASGAMPAAAQPWPSRPIRLVVDGPPGSVNDIWGRRYAQRMGDALGQPIVVDNRAGASGTIAAEAAIRAAPDGYTVFYGGLTPLVVYPNAGGTVRYDPLKDLAPVALGIISHPMLVTPPGAGMLSFAQLVERARAQPDQVLCGTAGNASMQHFACSITALAAGVKLRTVHYKGGPPAMLDAANGQVQLAVGFATELEPYTASGKLVALAAFAPQRMAKFPAVPSTSELGLPGLELLSFAGFFVPAGTPADIIERLNAESLRAMARPEMVEWRNTAGAVHRPLSVTGFTELYTTEQARWKRMANETGIRAE